MTKKVMRAILIDPKNRTVEEIQMKGGDYRETRGHTWLRHFHHWRLSQRLPGRRL
jgi:hypothetical protein